MSWVKLLNILKRSAKEKDKSVDYKENATWYDFVCAVEPKVCLPEIVPYADIYVNVLFLQWL